MSNSDSVSSPLMPGDRFILPEHSWALCRQDGIVLVGIETSCLQAIGAVSEISLPEKNISLDQGHPGLILTTSDGEEHTIFLPVSGRVVKINEEVVHATGRLQEDTWLLELLPSDLHEELSFLRKSKRSGHA